ncbi:hypothetical protein ACOBQX_13660 [Actinokineospora sp. G85]|uniref:hypothetical protein n=1 Tax=Actinokineospora sp. G85 TaxID=3406626 RepID=UPI003C742087
MTEGNPILTAAAEETSAAKTPVKHALEGAGFFQDIIGGTESLMSNDWAAGVTDLSVGLVDYGRAFQDPLGSLLSAGFGWLIEHVGPLKDLLDQLTGNQDALDMTVQTWSKISEEVQKTAEGMVDSVNTNTASWSGPAVDTYRVWAQGQADAYLAISNSATGVAGAVDFTKSLLNAVRGFIRGLLADLLAKLVSILLRYPPPAYLVALAAEGAPLIASSTAKGIKVVRALVDAFKELATRLGRLSGLVADVGRHLYKNLPELAAEVTVKKLAVRAGEEVVKEMGVKYSLARLAKGADAVNNSSTEAGKQIDWQETRAKEDKERRETRVERTPTGGTRETGSLW